VLCPVNRNLILFVFHHAFGFNSLDHRFKIHNLPLDESLQNLIRVLHGLGQLLKLNFKTKLVLILKEHVLATVIADVMLGRLEAVHDARVVVVDQAFDSKLGLVAQRKEIVTQHIFLVQEEEVIQLLVTTPASIKTLLHFINLFSKLLKEMKISLALNAESIDLQIDWLEGIILNLAHNRVIWSDVLHHFLNVDLGEVRKSSLDVHVGPDEELQLL